MPPVVLECAVSTSRPCCSCNDPAGAVPVTCPAISKTAAGNGGFKLRRQCSENVLYKKDIILENIWTLKHTVFMFGLKLAFPKGVKSK